MLQRLSGYLAELFIKNGLVDKQNKDIYTYGAFLILSTLQTSLVILILCALFGNVLIGVVFLASMMSIRFFAGGYHAETYFRCFLLSIGLAVFVFVISMVTPSTVIRGLSILLTTVSAIYLFIHTPLINANNPLSHRQILKNRRISRGIILVQASIVLLGAIFARHDILYFYSAAVATFVVAILFFWGQQWERKHSDEKNDS